MKITKDDARRILGVREDSSPDEVRSSYKRLALKWHPDKHGDSHVSKDEATQKFQEVSAAYKRLTTNANDNDDEIDDSEFMNIREMMELFAHIFFHNGVRSCPHHGMECCDYEDEYMYSDDEYYDYTDEESEDEFLDTIAHRLRNKYEARKYESVTKNTMQTQRRVTEEEALRNARELIEEEELEKKREEKKKAKRKKKKEKKKQRDKEKKDQENLLENLKKASSIAEEIKEKPNNKENNNPEKSKLTNGSIVTEEKPKDKITDTNGTAKGKRNKNDNKKSSDISKSNNKDQKNKNKDDIADKKNKTASHRNTDSDVDEEAIDTNSAFFARAASKAPTLQQNGFVPHSEPIKDQPPNNNKKKKNNQASKQQQSTTQSKKNKKQIANSSTDQNNKKSDTKEDNTPKIPTSSKTTVAQTTNTITPPKTEQNISPKINTTKSETSNGSDIDGIILQSRQVAVQGNQMAQTGDYHGAVKMFSKAIQLDPSDFRFFGNRSYCYDRIEKYDNALKDADSAINLASEWPKGYFRKGRALTGLKRFQEAEQVFQQVLKLDPVCEDAVFELVRVRVQILIDMGFTQALSEQAVRTYGTVQQALEALLAGKVSDEEDSDNAYISDEETQHTTQNRNIENYIQNKKIPKTIQTKPPEPKCTALWVGNVDPEMVTEKQMTQLFSKCGKVNSVRILPHKYCAFVNYNDPQCAVAAMEKLQGAGLGNQKLLLRFPNNPPPGSYIPENNTTQTSTTFNNTKNKTPSVSDDKMSGPVNGNECYFWRTTGCVFENQCRYKHVRGHKGVDLSKVQAKYGKIPTN